MRHVGELFKIVMDVTGGKDGGGGEVLKLCDVCSVFGWGGGAGKSKIMKFHAGGGQKQTCMAPF